ncbi:prepilin-type N-terminal cleavage/methylation domain-containing protein [bacterium]|nr:prepilin-type N-terminal cleavage/methylation domain-containing protein [bacterium]
MLHLKIHKKFDVDGFTLVELMIVIVIAGLLASIAATSYYKYIKNSKLSEGYLYLRKMYDGAVTYASEPGLLYTSDNQVYPKKHLFGTFYSRVPDNNNDYSFMCPPKNGLKEVVYFELNDPSLRGPSGNRIMNNPNHGIDIFGFSLSEQNVGSDTLYSNTKPGYFAFANVGDPSLATLLASEGKNATFETSNDIEITNSLWVYADLDGDFDCDSDGEEIGQLIMEPSERSNWDTLTMMMRGIYKDTVSGEIMGTEGIYIENKGE